VGVTIGLIGILTGIVLAAKMDRVVRLHEGRLD
jgi:hypothetical protein